MKFTMEILGLSEVRRTGERIITIQKGNLFYHIGNNEGQKEVGFLVKSTFNPPVAHSKNYINRTRGRFLTTLNIYICKVIITLLLNL